MSTVVSYFFIWVLPLRFSQVNGFRYFSDLCCGKKPLVVQRMRLKTLQSSLILDVLTNLDWLVVYLPLWKICSSIGMMTFPIYGKINVMFQTTNQLSIPLNPIKPPFSYGFPMVFPWFSYQPVVSLDLKVINDRSLARLIPGIGEETAQLPLPLGAGLWCKTYVDNPWKK